MSGEALEAIRYVRGRLLVLDQLRLPHEFVYDDVSTCELAFDCIKAMRVRGTTEDTLEEEAGQLILGQEHQQLPLWQHLLWR
jgi:methylthioribose-1-phosphate isomerase